MEKFDGVDFMEIDSLFSEEEILIRDTARKFVQDRLMPIIEKHNREALDRLFKQIEVEPMEKARSDSTISGKTVVFTGTLERLVR